ncbi:threonine dehydratase, medium form [Desulfosporosinus orientis DSM 765]|uniref:L-threonine dehydratase catabolic TdcB n=1 Tax=Desulfosporosinus orientis (strain ATCC 19365 / DSM 765 / NCIMB 8382 / VKM B-1628 / Singapore I) TaxID=768706 RepID=G7WCI1_DESOD|nr:threonine ammonia-lyase [Desulfosporosinus orientis]AET66303.1 threonine dehydratase, medium form [Desulfosporosinus orientis DSM 765]
MKNISFQEIKKAQIILQGVSYNTALVYNHALSDLSGNQVYVKMENLQRTGSFKLRGAYNKISNLTPEEKQRGVIASSAGNHAQGVAVAATLYGIKATIVMPSHAPLSKVSATRNYGAEVILHGENYDEAYNEALRLQAETQATFIHPFNDPLVIAGQGTIGLEILDDLPDVEIVVLPIGGGGLISGIALAVKTLNPAIKVIGVQSKNNPSMAESVAQQHITTIKGIPSIADGIAVKTPGDLTFDLVKQYVDEIITVDEDEIASTMLLFLESAKVVAEGAGAAAAAGIIHSLSEYKNRKIAAVISGGNVDVNLLARTIDKGLVNKGRKCFLTTVISDRPGALAQLLQLIACKGANVLAVTHRRETLDIPISYAKVELELETTDPAHVQKIKTLVEENYYRVDVQ